jgi:hypothetical protein
MRRKMTTLRAKSGGVQNGNGSGHPRSLLDEATYREHRNNANVHANSGASPHYDSEYSGWSNASRPRDQAISLRSVTPKSPPPG